MPTIGSMGGNIVSHGGPQRGQMRNPLLTNLLMGPPVVFFFLSQFLARVSEPSFLILDACCLMPFPFCPQVHLIFRSSCLETRATLSVMFPISPDYMFDLGHIWPLIAIYGYNIALWPNMTIYGIIIAILWQYLVVTYPYYGNVWPFLAQHDHSGPRDQGPRHQRFRRTL